MKHICLSLFVLFFISCSTNPEPLVAGRDICSSCKMPISDVKFGAEIITTKGKIYKFDDILCLVNFYTGEIKAGEETKAVLAVSYEDGQKLVDVHSASFLHSDKLRTPMNGGIAAFETNEQAKQMQQNYPGKILSWKEVTETLK